MKIDKQYKKLCKNQEHTPPPSVSSEDNIDAKTRRCSKPNIYDAILPSNLKTKNGDSDPLSATKHRKTQKMTKPWRGLSLG